MASLDVPDNGPNCKNWLVTKGIWDPDVHESYRHFYADTFDVRKRWLLLWERLAQNFANHSGVIGYDIINEPWGSEANDILPLYEACYESVLDS